MRAEQESKDDPSHGPTNRRFRLFHLLILNTCTREDIFARLRDYYKLPETASPPDDLALQSSTRTFQRDLQNIESMGYNIERQQHTGNTFYHIAVGSDLAVPFLFNQAELDVLILLHTLFADPAQYQRPMPTQPLPAQPPRNPFAEDILSLVERLAATLSAKQKREFARWVRKPFVYLNLDTVTDYLPHRATIDALIRAISYSRKVSFSYTSMQRQPKPTPHKEVDPYYIIHQDGHLYLVGYSHSPFRSGWSRVYEFRIDRIDADSIIQLPGEIDRELQQRPITFRYWLDASLAQSGLSNRWLTQEIEREETLIADGKEVRRLLVKAQAYNDFRIIQQLHKYGTKVELLDPPELREKMRSEVEQLYHLYHPENRT